MREDLQTLGALLDILEEILESYQMDIRDRGLAEEGFCQGRIYLNAPAKVKRAREIVSRLQRQCPQPAEPLTAFAGELRQVRIDFPLELSSERRVSVE